MTQLLNEKVCELEDILCSIERVAVAVSGGVDSLTLACVAHSSLGTGATMFHAVSPAVPPEATERTRQHAEKFGWRLEIIEAGEFSDPEYLSNPVNRCFYCKTNLYGKIASETPDMIVSGANMDDMSDFRPGLQAAKQHRVRHPYVEARIDKMTVRSIANHFNLGPIARLPASPCLSSRVETGIMVDARTLFLVHEIENIVRKNLAIETVRCRVRRDGLVVELDDLSHDRLVANDYSSLQSEIELLGATHGFPGEIRFEPYRMGSAFLRA